MKKDQIESATSAPKAKLQFAARLSPKKEEQTEAKDLGIPVVSELEIRLPVGLAAGRTTPSD